MVHPIQTEQMPSKTRIFRTLYATADESTVLTQAYCHLHPHIWDNKYYQSPDRARNWKVDQTTNQGSLLRSHSYLALATSTLAFLQPDKYSMQLHFRHLHAAVAAMRRFIAQNQSDPNPAELVLSISRTLMASVIHEDIDPARAHLAAAVTVVTQMGGINAIDARVATLLRYADFHLATVTLRGPVFPISDTPDDENDDPAQALTSDPLLAELIARVRADSTTATLPPVIFLAVHGLLDTVLASAHFASQSVSLGDLKPVSTRIVTIVSRILQHRPSVLVGSDNLQASAGPRTLHSRRPIWQPSCGPEPGLDEWTIVLIMWSQLILCSSNAPLGGARTRYAFVQLLPIPLPPYQPQYHGDRSAWLASLSQPVRDGLRAWNQRVLDAHKATPPGKLAADSDWEGLIDIVANMEIEFPARMAPVVRRLLFVRSAQASAARTA